MKVKNLKNKKIVLIIAIILVLVLIVGGTYAYLSSALDVTNGNYSGKVECFKINYGILNDDNSEDITGTLFASKSANGGLNGKISLGVDSTCDITGVGTLYIHINEGTSTTLVQTVGEHCENPLTLETMDEYDNSSDCATNNGIWVTNGTALKYAVYDNGSATGEPFDVGYVTTTDIGNDISVYTGFDVNHTVGNYYIYIWMDGYLMDETYTNLAFGGYVHASVLQNE